MTVEQDRSAALLIRVWLESDPDGFRGRLTSVDTAPGHGGAEVTVGVVSSPEALLETVRTWLDEFTGRAPRPEDTGS